MPLLNKALAMALAGGEDYELIFTTPKSRKNIINELSRSLELEITCIGEVKKEPGLSLLDKSGKETEAPELMFEHFSKAAEKTAG